MKFYVKFIKRCHTTRLKVCWRAWRHEV